MEGVWQEVRDGRLILTIGGRLTSKIGGMLASKNRCEVESGNSGRWAAIL